MSGGVARDREVPGHPPVELDAGYVLLREVVARPHREPLVHPWDTGQTRERGQRSVLTIEPGDRVYAVTVQAGVRAGFLVHDSEPLVRSVIKGLNWLASVVALRWPWRSPSLNAD
ncbi:hypothetical protein AB0L13_45360 [Saccharopolyspora shandongensis]|uniref:hypothetical protein n=1 Tax=Saccharopolyspora shandongensis TaxID=418495 RepID=UPI003443198C